jgi:hypothetical protein
VISNAFLIEEFVGKDSNTQSIDDQFDDQEIAIDLYYDASNRPIILNILHHPASTHSDYFNLLYYTSYEVFDVIYDLALDFFQALGSQLPMQSLPLHAEFKLIKNQLIPIEINPCRFAGFGCADLIYHAFGMNPYSYFFNGQSINWEKVWENHKNNYYGWVCGYTGTEFNKTIHEPDHASFKQRLGDDILHYEKINYHTYPVFAIAYVRKKDKNELLSLCDIEFNQCIQKIPHP